MEQMYGKTDRHEEMFSTRKMQLDGIKDEYMTLQMIFKPFKVRKSIIWDL